MAPSATKKPAVVIISNLYPNQFEKTRGLFIKQLTDSISNKLPVTVISPVPFNPFELLKPKTKRLPKLELIDNIEVYHPRYIVIPKLLRSLTGYFFYLGIKKTISKLVKQQRVDILSAHWVYPDGFGSVLAANKFGLPIAVHALGCDINEYTKYKIRRHLIKKTLNQSSLNIVKSTELKDKIESLGVEPNKTIVIHNGVNQNKFKPEEPHIIRQELGLFADRKYCLFVGNFQIEKGLNFLIDAFALLKQNNVSLLVIGSGPLEQELRKQIKELDLVETVQFIGRVEHHLIPKYLSAADLLCLPSLREGCPNVVLESLSCGTPVVASDVGAVRDILTKPEFGVVVPPKDPAALAKGITLGLNLEKATMPNFKWYSWEENAELIIRHFENLTNKHN